MNLVVQRVFLMCRQIARDANLNENIASIQFSELWSEFRSF